MTINVKLRQRLIKGNRSSLYLDYYPAIPHPVTGKLTRREFLGYYLFIKPKTVLDKQQNNETLQMARKIRQKRDEELNSIEPSDGKHTARNNEAPYERQNFMNMAYKARRWDSIPYSGNKKSNGNKIVTVEEVMDKEDLTVLETATLLNCSVRSVYYYIRLGRIKSFRNSKRRTMVKRSEIDKLFEYPETL
jgi:hypothetical protein